MTTRSWQRLVGILRLRILLAAGRPAPRPHEERGNLVGRREIGRRTQAVQARAHAIVHEHDASAHVRIQHALGQHVERIDTGERRGLATEHDPVDRQVAHRAEQNVAALHDDQEHVGIVERRHERRGEAEKQHRFHALPDTAAAHRHEDREQRARHAHVQQQIGGNLEREEVHEPAHVASHRQLDDGDAHKELHDQGELVRASERRRIGALGAQQGMRKLPAHEQEQARVERMGNRGVHRQNVHEPASSRTSSSTRAAASSRESVGNCPAPWGDSSDRHASPNASAHVSAHWSTPRTRTSPEVGACCT